MLKGELTPTGENHSATLGCLVCSLLSRLLIHYYNVLRAIRVLSAGQTGRETQSLPHPLPMPPVHFKVVLPEQTSNSRGLSA